MAVATETVAIEQEREKAAAPMIKRFDVHQIIQHGGLAISFILLVVTGLPLKYADLGISQWWAVVLGGPNNLSGIHHFAGYMMVVVCLYHALYLLYSIAILKRPFPYAMIPNLDDARKLYREFLYFVGVRKDKPQFGRFNWREKFDYWAIFWGVPVMAGSGFVLMYPIVVSQFMPGWVVPAALVAHSDEAMLALGWIFLVHVFFNHFVPGIFPLNTSMFTGKLTHERYEKDHPLEYTTIMRRADAAESGAAGEGREEH